MTSFDTLSALARAFFALWALLLCLACIGNVLLPLWRKRFLFSVLALVLLAPAYLIWQVIFDIALKGRLGIPVSSITLATGGVAWVWWLVTMLVLTAATVLLLVFNIRYERRHITLASVKQYLDKLPSGVCCWKDNGRVLFANMRINDLCVAITDGQLLNGNAFGDAVADKILTVDGRSWRFAVQDITVGKEQLHEMIATDVTSELAKAQALQEDKAELSRLNRELKEYNRTIDETVRRQEILQAKVNIHDEMNKLMLSTVAAASDQAALDKIFSLWEQNALLLCMQADGAEDKKAVDSVERLAAALKIRLVWREALPSTLSEPQRDLFLSAAQEAVANAAKHAEAKEIVISFEETDGRLVCRLTNDGLLPQGAVTYTGGLLNLALLADKQGAIVETTVDDRFTLALVFPLSNQPHG
ncbi:MAG: hypothetical protein J5755_02890 [Clostridia bacterium]|nr:hypothetical protein [Clostridia bacterium]